ncbi:MAG: Uma2 family endonuclease [Clostridiales bacterium]|jgi:Uma2 family endonuclease|nr:Uma2 family endonuclease [Clostridiales bacterium]
MDMLVYKEEWGHELLGGSQVYSPQRPPVSHSIVANNIFQIFSNYLENEPCMAFTNNVDVYLGENDVVVPDVMIVGDLEIVKRKGILGAPDLIVEILAPSTAKNDRGYKKDLYEKFGVKEFWIVDVESRSIDVYILLDGKYELDNIYYHYPDYLLDEMSEDEKRKITYEFKASMFPNMVISLSMVFRSKVYLNS